MKHASSQSFVRDFNLIHQAGTVSGLTDPELLGRFKSRESGIAQQAFEAIVHRHGPMLLGVCRRVLRDEHAAEDAFQATFLVLTTRGDSIRKSHSLGPWLHGVAARIARRARAVSRRRGEQRSGSEKFAWSAPQSDEIEAAELRSLLDEEIQRLPAMYRRAIVLCYLEGKSQEAAAQELGCTKGTVSGRLARAKERLRSRLARRGIALSLGGVGVLLATANASASVPASVIATALQAALHVSLGGSERTAATRSAVALANGAVRAMVLANAKTAAAALLVVVVLAAAVAQTAIGPEPPGPRRFEGPRATLRLRPARPDDTSSPTPPEPGLPAHARVRLGTTHLRLDGQPHLVMFSPDGRTLASTSFNEVQFWDAATGGPAPGRPTLKEWSNVMSLAYSPDGNTIAIGHFDGVIRLWDPVASRERLCIRGHRGWVMDIAFAPDGRSLATVTSGDSLIRVWDAVTGRERRALAIDSPAFRDAEIAWGSLAFAPDGRRLAVSARPVPGRAEMIGICELVGNGKPVIIPNAHKVGVHSLIFTPDGRTLLSSGDDTRRIEDHDQAVFMVEYLPQLEYVPKLRLWDAATGRLLRELDPGEVTGECAIALSRDGRTLVSSHRDRLLVWDLATGRIVRSIPAETNNLPLSARSLAIGPDGRTLASLRGDHTLHLWDLVTGQPLFRRGEGHESAVLSAAIAPGGRFAATADARGTIHLWDTMSGQHLRRIDTGEQAEIGALAFSPDGLTIGAAAHYFDYRTPPFRWRALARSWTVSDGAPRGDLRIDTAANDFSRATRIAYSPDAQRIAIALEVEPMRPGFGPKPNLKPEFVIQVREAATGLWQIDLRGHQGAIRAIGFAPDGKGLVSAGADMTFRFWDLATGKTVRQFPIAGHLRSDAGELGKPAPLSSAVFSADLTRAITSGEQDDRLIIWDLTPNRLRRQAIRVDGNRGATLAVSPDGRIMAETLALQPDPMGDNTSIGLRSSADGREWLRLETGGRRVRCLAFSADGKTLISGMNDTTAIVWDVSAAGATPEKPPN